MNPRFSWLPRRRLEPAAAVMLALALGGCNILPRLMDIGRAPDLSEIKNPAPLAG